MVRKPRRQPSYRQHKATGQACVDLPIGNGKRKVVYLGKYNSAESLDKYEQVVGDWFAKRPIDSSRDALTVRDMAERYQSDQEPKISASKRYHLASAVRFMSELFESRPAQEFDALQFSRIRAHLIKQGYSRKYGNDILVIAKRCVTWAMQRDLISTDLHTKIQSVDLITAKEAPTKQVLPVTNTVVEWTLPLLSTDFQDTIRFLRASGCRPGEARMMRVGDVDRENWLFKPTKHKTAHKGKSRAIPIPSNVQAMLLPRLLRPDDAFVFGADGGTRPYEKRSLGRAIDHAIKRLNVERDEAGDPPIEHWHPYQLRHARATEVRAKYGVEVAQVVLGHSRIDMTQHYAEITEKKAAEVGRLLR
jgi:integrase